MFLCGSKLPEDVFRAFMLLLTFEFYLHVYRTPKNPFNP